MNIRIGTGFDIHRLEEGRQLIIGGVNIDYNKGFIAHSDGDVLIHAIIDSIFGALAIGDIGTYFPDTDIAFKDISSIILLEKAINIMEEKGYSILNIDCTIKAQKPKMKNIIPIMKKLLSKKLKIDIDNLSIKAKTMEALGPIGNCDAIAADVVVLLIKQSN